MSNYNGWTNYATWRVNLELFDGYEGTLSADTAREIAEELIESSSTEGTARAYARAFIADVNWHEIAGHYEAEPEVDE